MTILEVLLLSKPVLQYNRRWPLASALTPHPDGQRKMIGKDIPVAGILKCTIMSSSEKTRPAQKKGRNGKYTYLCLLLFLIYMLQDNAACTALKLLAVSWRPRIKKLCVINDAWPLLRTWPLWYITSTPCPSRVLCERNLVFLTIALKVLSSLTERRQGCKDSNSHSVRFTCLN